MKPELRGSIEAIQYPCYVEIKRDGEYCVRNIADNTFVGELCYKDGKFGDLYKLLSNKKKLEDIVFWAHDCVQFKGLDIRNEPLTLRREALNSLECIYSDNFRINKPLLAMNRGDVDTLFKFFTDSGFEGIVVKNTQSRFIEGPCGWVKLKKKDQNEYIVSFIDPVRERIEVSIPQPDGYVVKCGVKVVNTQKNMLTIGELVKIEHQGVLEGGSLRHPVYKGAVNGKNN